MAQQQRPRPGRRYPLLLYQRLFENLRGRALLLAVLSYVLWLVAVEVPFLAPRGWLLWAIIVIAGFLFLFSYLGPQLSFVQCRPNYLLVSTPFYRLALSYRRIRSVRPTDFTESYNIEQQKWSQQRFLRSLFKYSDAGQLTVIEVELKKLPLSKRWLQLWMSRYMFAVKMEGLFLLVRDWMRFSRELEEHRGRYVRSRSARAQAKGRAFDQPVCGMVKESGATPAFRALTGSPAVKVRSLRFQPSGSAPV